VLAVAMIEMLFDMKSTRLLAQSTSPSYQIDALFRFPSSLFRGKSTAPSAYKPVS